MVVLNLHPSLLIFKFFSNFIYNISLNIKSANLTKKAICTWLAYKNNNKHNNNDKKSYSLYNVASVREEFWVSPWFVSHAKNVIRGAYDGGHFNSYIVEVLIILLNTRIIRGIKTGGLGH